MVDYSRMEPTAVPTGALTTDGFGAFYDDALPVVYGYFLNRTGDRQLSEELTQETFASALVSLRSGATVIAARPWIVTIARRRFIDRIRSDALRQRLGPALDRPGGDDSYVTEAEVRLHAALGQLDVDQRLALVLRYVDDLPVVAVAEALARTPKAAESLLARARRALEHHFAEATDVP